MQEQVCEKYFMY